MDHPIISVNLLAAIILFGLLQLLILLFFFGRKARWKNDKWFSLFISVMILTQVETFFIRSGLMAEFPHLLNTSVPLLFLLGPLLFLHSQKRLGKPARLRQSWLHFIPFAFYLGYSCFFFVQPEAYKLDAFIRSFQVDLPLTGAAPVFDTDPLRIQGLVVVELISLHIIVYAFYTLWQLWQTPKTASHHWLWFVNGMLALGGITLFLSQGGIVNGNRFLESFLPHFSADLFPTLATYALSIYVINRKPEGMEKRKYAKSALSHELKAPRAHRVHEILKNEQPFLSQEFSLKKLAELCQMSPHHLSQILNEQMQVSFFELVNQYRVSEAKKRLNKKDNLPKMEQLAYDLGYKSKSTFYTAFKRQTGITPAQYHLKQD